ncbi:MAG: Flavinator of succinate dehydrogenase [Candidatus Tokpelaia hoelldobleri]|uniref:FAD assembly factor SdhE n=1 Tax=Candidatus Tokpelaia hoelldobleri TaxID=1902579 RepID=A0A1U9JU43_9HYPH|nr:MAG: Flavinator of succinate dehydrogenase [Candidatus Tokpelaia hoelldoblerii]
MPESILSASSLDTRRRRIAYRAWHRGIREMDLILGQYVDTHIISLGDGELDALEYIMSFEDRDLLTWFTGEVKTPDDVDTPIFKAILKHRETMDFV